LNARYDDPVVSNLGAHSLTLVALGIRTSAEARFAKVMHFRDTKGNREIDLIVERVDGKILAI
jgi:hypothetical protein